MSVADLKRVVNELSSEERQWLAAYLHELERQPDDRRLAELDERMADMDAGRKRVPMAEAEERLGQGKSDRQ